MAKHNGLEELFTDMADAIREQAETTESMKVDDMPDNIRSIPRADMSLYAPLEAPVFHTSITLGEPGENGQIGLNSMFIGKSNIGLGTNSLAIGTYNKLRGESNFVAGSNNETSTDSDFAVCIGEWSKALGSHCVAMGRLAQASGTVSMAFGNDVVSSGTYTVAMNFGTVASGNYATALNDYTTAKGIGSLATGGNSMSNADYSFTAGYDSIADVKNSMVIGHRNKQSSSGNSNENNQTGDAFIIGNGISDSNRSNAFRISFNGASYGLSSFNSSGADYAEYFEWLDGNPNYEDRVGYFVTLKGNKIAKANEGDYILGVVSGQPCIIGNADEDWQKRYLKDDFGRFIMTMNEVELTRREPDGKIVGTGDYIPNVVYKENPDYNPTMTYVERKDRREWSAIGMVGVLAVRDDGTCVVDGYCKPTENGIGTYTAEKEGSFRVIERVSDGIIKVIVK